MGRAARLALWPHRVLPMTDQTPRTDAGRRHLDWLNAGDDVFPEDALATVLAIEDEARTEALDVEVLESAMWNLDGGGGRRADDDYYTRYAERLIESYRAILAARKAVR